MHERTVAAVVGGFVFSLILILSSVAVAGTLSWTAPDRYTDNTVISTADKAAAVYTPAWSGTGATGPWTNLSNTAPGATSATVPNPTTPGSTRWYSVRVTINGQTSAYATPGVAFTLPFPVPDAPSASGLVFQP